MYSCVWLCVCMMEYPWVECKRALQGTLRHSVPISQGRQAGRDMASVEHKIKGTMAEEETDEKRDGEGPKIGSGC